MSKIKKIAQQDNYVIKVNEEFYQNITKIKQIDEKWGHEVVNLISVLRKLMNQLSDEAIIFETDVHKLKDIQKKTAETSFECVTLLDIVSRKINHEFFTMLHDLSNGSNTITGTRNASNFSLN